MSTISDDTDNIHNYIEEKKRYEHDENWEVSFDAISFVYILRTIS